MIDVSLPPMERDVLPMTPVYCPVCRISDCSLGAVTMACPLAKAKWEGVVIPLEEFAAQSGRPSAPAGPKVATPEAISAPPPREEIVPVQQEQLSLF